MANLAYLEADFVKEPARDQTAMAPGGIGRRTLKTKQRGNLITGERSQLAEHLIGVEFSSCARKRVRNSSGSTDRNQGPGASGLYMR